MNEKYQHTQIAWLFTGVILFANFHWIVLYVFILFTVCLALFPTLTVKVTSKAVELWFGAGLIRKAFPLAQIQSVQFMTNSPLYGWGIRPLASGWLYNVSGSRCVELQLKDSRKYRIGSDEPEALAQAILITEVSPEQLVKLKKVGLETASNVLAAVENPKTDLCEACDLGEKELELLCMTLRAHRTPG